MGEVPCTCTSTDEGVQTHCGGVEGSVPCAPHGSGSEQQLNHQQKACRSGEESLSIKKYENDLIFFFFLNSKCCGNQGKGIDCKLLTTKDFCKSHFRKCLTFHI